MSAETEAAMRYALLAARVAAGYGDRLTAEELENLTCWSTEEVERAEREYAMEQLDKAIAKAIADQVRP